MSSHLFPKLRRRRWAAVVVAASLATPTALVAGAPPAAADVTAQSRTIQGSASNHQEKEWFNKSFDTGEHFFGNLRGRVRLVTDTKATLSTTRDVSVDGRTAIAGSNASTLIHNDAVASELHVTARPALQLIFEWQPQGDSYVCNNDNFPTFSGDDWYMRTDGGGPIRDGMCGAIEVTADDISRIAQLFNVDLDLPEEFNVLDRFFTAAYSGTQPITQSQQVLEIKVCKIVGEVTGLGIGDHCDLELNAVTTAPLTTLSHQLDAQYCTTLAFAGHPVDCGINLGNNQSLTFPGSERAVSAKVPCPTEDVPLDMRITDPEWNTRLEDVSIGLSLDFNVHVTANGDGWDLITIPLPGSISLLDNPMPLNVTYPTSDSFTLHVGTVGTDTLAPFVFVDPAVTVNEGSSAVFNPILLDLCTAQADEHVKWTMDGIMFIGPSLTRSFANDKPNAVHSGTVVVTDEAGNASDPLPLSVTVRNVPPSVQMAGFPAIPIPVGTTLNLAAQVADPGSDIENWQWSFGDGTNVSRTGTSVTDRSDSRSHTYPNDGLYTLQVGVNDGTDLSSAGGSVTVFDKLSKLNGKATFTADSSSIGVPAGSTYAVDTNLGYPGAAVRPTGSFSADFVLAGQGAKPAAQHLVGSSYEWLFSDSLNATVQGLASLNGVGGWKFQAQLTRLGANPNTSRITVTVWRPGITSLANPDYRFGGPRGTGNIH